MPTNHTPNYDLSQWEPSDKVLRTDFNADNAKIDAALAGKASAAAVDSLARTVAGHASALVRTGNCRIYTTTYTGPGGAGESGAVQLTFPGKPELVAVADPGSGAFILMIQGCRYTQRSNSTSSINVTWRETPLDGTTTTAVTSTKIIPTPLSPSSAPDSAAALLTKGTPGRSPGSPFLHLN